MMNAAVILNESGAREARAMAAELEKALSSERTFERIIAGLPLQVVNGFRRALNVELSELKSLVDAYEAAKAGDYEELKRRAGEDPGLALVVARIARGLTQKDLARKLGLKEQQIQRYEADRYRSINLSNYRRIASVLGVHWEVKLSDWVGSGWNVATEVLASDVIKILKHARTHGWFDGEESSTAEEESYNYLQRYVSDHILRYGSPSLLRTGLNVEDYKDDLSLLAWKARITRRAELIIEESKIKYQILDISWLLDLVRLSGHEDGPEHAVKFLRQQGIVLIVEPQIAGMRVDGAAFLVDGVPVIGMTLRRDTIDNFWFTLLHEVAHIVLHYRTGLSHGFFDDIDSTTIEEVEREANDFASNILIPEEKWKRSPARIAKSPAVVEKFASELGIHSAIVFGRIQKERKDYAVFSNKIGRGLVRKVLIPEILR